MNLARSFEPHGAKSGVRSQAEACRVWTMSRPIHSVLSIGTHFGRRDPGYTVSSQLRTQAASLVYR